MYLFHLMTDIYHFGIRVFDETDDRYYSWLKSFVHWHPSDAFHPGSCVFTVKWIQDICYKCCLRNHPLFFFRGCDIEICLFLGKKSTHLFFLIVFYFILTKYLCVDFRIEKITWTHSSRWQALPHFAILTLLSPSHHNHQLSAIKSIILYDINSRPTNTIYLTLNYVYLIPFFSFLFISFHTLPFVRFSFHFSFFFCCVLLFIIIFIFYFSICALRITS